MGSGASKAASTDQHADVDSLFSGESSTLLTNAMAEAPVPETQAAIDATDYIYVIHYDDFAKCGSFPRNPEQSMYLRQLSKIPRETSFIVYISHVWIRHNSDCPGWEGFPHPDYRFAYKYKLCLDGIQKAHKMYAPGMRECYIWCDYCCLNQNNLYRDIEPNILLFDKIMSYADCVFTPIYIEDEGYDKFIRYSQVNNPNHKTYTKAQPDRGSIPTLHNDTNTMNLENQTVPDYYANYEHAPLFNDKKNPRAFLNRAWCRMELLYAATMPLLEDENSDVIRRKCKFASVFRAHTNNNHRSHLLYTSWESRYKLSPIVLPLIPIAELLKLYNPLRGYTTHPQDREIIGRLHTLLKPHFKEALTRKSVANLFDLTAPQNNLNSNSGGGDPRRRLSLLPNGDIYMGELSSKVHSTATTPKAGGAAAIGGRSNRFSSLISGKMLSGSSSSKGGGGDIFAGSTRHGYGRNKTNKLIVYKGTYVDDQKSGYGCEKTPTGIQYYGEFDHDMKHGHGLLKYPNGDEYEGYFADDKKHGKGVYRYANGDVFTGDFVNDVKCGKGTCKYANGDSYEGYYENDLFHGYGQFNFENGQMYKGQWRNGLYQIV